MKRSLRRWMAALGAVALSGTLLQMAPTPARAVTPDATAILGAEPSYTGVTSAWPGDADKDWTHAVDTRDGKSCWTMRGDPYTRYLYVNVADSAIPAGSTRALVSIEYFDARVANTDIQYDSTSNAFTGSSNLAMIGSGTWRTHQFELTNINFKNRANGADFRLNVKAGADTIPPICFSRIDVRFTTLPLLDITTPNLMFTQSAGNVINFSTAADTVAWTIGDPNGVPLSSGTATANSSGAASVSIGNLGPGYYTLKATANSGSPVTRTTSFGVVTPLPAGALSPNSYFGVAGSYGNMGAYDDPLWDALATVGWGYGRADANWGAIEREPGVYNFPSYRLDPGLKDGYQRGITTLPIIAYRNALYDGGKTPSTPDGLAAFARFGAATSVNYKAYTNNISVYNEYNSSGFNDGACGITPQCYLNMVKAVYPAIKAANPQANVTGPVSAGTQIPWHDEFFRLGGLNYLDTFNVNFYGYANLGPGTPPESTVLMTEFPQLVQKVKQYKDMPIWISENGWPTHTQGSTEAQQADYLIRAQTLARAAGADKYFWYNALDTGDNPAEREHRFGLFRRPGNGINAISPKPGAISQAVLIRQVTGKTLSARENAGDSAVYVYPYTGGNGTTRAMWSTMAKTVSIRTDTALTLTDQFGKVTTLSPVAGKVTLDLDASPVFIAGPVKGVSTVSTVSTVLSMDTTAQSITGESLPVTVTADRTHNTEVLPSTLNVDVDGVKATLKTRPGQKSSVTLDLPATSTTGQRRVTATISADNRAVARLRDVTTVLRPLEVTGRPIIGKDNSGLRITVKNNSPSETLPVSSLGWRVGGWQGTVATPPQVAPASSASVEVALPAGVVQYSSYSYSVSVTSESGDALDSGSLSYSPIEPSGQSTKAPIDLNTLGKWVSIRGGTRTSPADLSGTIKYSYTNEALTLDAVITDEQHSANRPDGSLAWQVDSLQYNIYSKFPSEQGGSRVEVGAALLPSGPVAYTWAAPPGQSAGPTPGAKVTAVRDETAKTTTYSLTVPWTSLGYTAPPTGVIGLSFLVNDADALTGSDSRDGYLEWGGGVGSAPKNPALFRSAQLVS